MARRTAAKVMQSALDATSGQTSASCDMRQYTNIAVQGIAASLDQADGTLTIEGSIDGTNWDALATATTFGSGSTNELIFITGVYCQYVRVVWAEGTNTAGTITTKIQFTGLN
tara:strand:- start:632 stop:970 length:339 start_codon:yes stop_codon:yes gene_type:complete